ncbi:hypothetical protein BDM02DRAFT_1999371 [Thelephora ganbajun]|uniref:Uncharacterized protein n=1 Tax=Thelephora ganbajun TaxID=370292 RepID=A0ACB6ZHD4_THEGA|nr:hypothetical protein BDM02DRAFT_1999371 [Thelephora ganbajun]
MPQRCKPPTGRKARGPDSTRLSFLLNVTLREIKERGVKTDGWFGELISLNVDDQFQSYSSEMSLKTSETSRRLGIPHKTLQISWGFPPYAVKPSLGRSFECIARDARDILLFGFLGLGGMKPSRGLEWVMGHRGRWVGMGLTGCSGG